MAPGVTIPEDVAGLHMLYAPGAGSDSRAQRAALRQGIESLLAGWRWQSTRAGSNGRRLCAREHGEPAPPVSISYSGQFAMLAVSNDWRSVGVDLEIISPRRVKRYADIIETFTGQTPGDPLRVFVRAEAWAKASDCGFIFGARYFLRESMDSGLRNDGRTIRDIDLSRLLPEPVSHTVLGAAALCTDAQSPDPTIHPLVILTRDASLSIHQADHVVTTGE